MRVAPDEAMFILNLTAEEAAEVLEVTQGQCCQPF